MKEYKLEDVKGTVRLSEMVRNKPDFQSILLLTIVSYKSSKIYKVCFITEY